MSLKTAVEALDLPEPPESPPLTHSEANLILSPQETASTTMPLALGVE